MRPPPLPGARAQPFVHPAVAGETLEALARRFALEPEALARANRLPPTAPLRPGQRLEIPGFISLPVGPTDTLYELRRKTGLSAGAIARFNALKDESEVALRRELAIPAPRRERSPITKVRLRPPQGLVVVTRGGRDTSLTTGAKEVFLIDGGAYVAWTSEASGGHLRVALYDAGRGKLRRLIDRLARVDGLGWARLKRGRLMLWLEGIDSRTREPFLSVLDPDRGEVYRQEHTEVVEREGDHLKLRAREGRRSSSPFRERVLDLAVL